MNKPDDYMKGLAEIIANPPAPPTLQCLKDQVAPTIFKGIPKGRRVTTSVLINRLRPDIELLPRTP